MIWVRSVVRRELPFRRKNIFVLGMVLRVHKQRKLAVYNFGLKLNRLFGNCTDNNCIEQDEQVQPLVKFM